MEKNNEMADEKGYRDRKRKKAAAAMTAAVLGLLLLAAGTLAWKDYNQHKSNEFLGDGLSEKYIVYLVEDFEEVNNWRSTDSPVQKEVRVANLGGTEEYPGDTGEYGDVYVRLQLKEYLEYSEDAFEYVYSDERLMIDETGNFIKFETKDEAIDEGYEEDDLIKIKGYWDEEAYFYVITKAHDPNGQYGKHLITDLDNDNEGKMISLVDGVEKATDIEGDPSNHHLGSTEECDYSVHRWDESDPSNCSHGFHDYVQWMLGDDIVLKDDWDGALTERWILDNNTGWAYWGVPLRAGKTTSNLLEKVYLKQDLPGPFYYTIHVDMEAVSYDDLWADNDMISDLREKYEEAYQNPGGLTGTTADIGKKFIADGYEWRVLHVDEEGNIRIITEKVIGTIMFGQTNLYTANNITLREYIDDIYDGMSELKTYNVKTVYPNEAAGYSDTTMPTIEGSGEKYHMGAPFVGEINEYFSSPADRVGYDFDGVATAYWTAHHGTAGTNTGRYINGSGALSNQTATVSSGVRPAMYINVTDAMESDE